MSLSYRSDFKGYMKRMQKIVEDRVQGLTNAQRLVEIAKILNGYRPSGKFHEQIMDIELQNWGTVRDFCKCHQVPDNQLM